MALLTDTSAILALVDAGSVEHRRVRRYIEEHDEALVAPITILPEVDYLVAQRFGVAVELATLRGMVEGGFRIENLTSHDLVRCLELIEQYADSDIGLVDASLVAIAERLRIVRILTLDQRHFRLFRPRHCAAFELLPWDAPR